MVNIPYLAWLSILIIDIGVLANRSTPIGVSQLYVDGYLDIDLVNKEYLKKLSFLI